MLFSHSQLSEDLIPRVIFDAILYKMGEAVVTYVSDPVVVDRIANAWMMIREKHPLTRGASSIEEGKEPGSPTKDEPIN